MDNLGRGDLSSLKEYNQRVPKSGLPCSLRGLGLDDLQRVLSNSNYSMILHSHTEFFKANGVVVPPPYPSNPSKRSPGQQELEEGALSEHL